MIVYLDETLNSGTPNRWQWPVTAANYLSISSQSSLSPPVQKQGQSTSLPPSPIDATFANSAIYVSPTAGLHKSVSVR